jgi:hypothetical protein
VAALAARLESYAAAPVRYRPAPAAAPIDWPGHVDAVLAAYAEAQPAGSGTHVTRH